MHLNNLFVFFRAPYLAISRRKSHCTNHSLHPKCRFLLTAWFCSDLTLICVPRLPLRTGQSLQKQKVQSEHPSTRHHWAAFCFGRPQSLSLHLPSRVLTTPAITDPAAALRPRQCKLKTLHQPYRTQLWILNYLSKVMVTWRSSCQVEKAITNSLFKRERKKTQGTVDLWPSLPSCGKVFSK